MCGISATLYKEKNTVRHHERVDLSFRMSLLLKHRGPDGQNNWNDGRCYLGFRHLALVGDNQSLQPFHNENGDIHVICNGEIYNHKQLQKKLEQKNHTFATHSDCEIIVHLYEEYRERICQMLQGQFAFILWDAKKNRLMAARDRFGICPLFFTKRIDRIVLGSEIKALFADSSIQATLNLIGIAQTALLYGPVPPSTNFKHIYQVPPGSYILIDVSNWKLTKKTYWVIDFRKGNPHTDEQIQSKFKSLCRNAVTSRIHGNFFPAVLASGGLDSSVIASILKYQQKNVDLFSLQFDTPDIDESAYQELLAKHIGATLHSLRVQTKDIYNNIVRCVWHCESPLTRFAPVPMMLLSEYVRKSGYKCVLSGEGADELLVGYPVFLKNKASVEQKYKSAQKMLMLLQDTSVRHAAQKSYQRLICHDIYKTKSRLEQSQKLEIRTKLSQYLLASQGDRVSLANGIEQRYPFLDELLVDYISILPEMWKCDTKSGKILLKQVFADVVPSQIVYRKKQGYMAPDASLFRARHFIQKFNTRYLSDEAVQSTGYFNIRSIRRLRQQSMLNTILDDATTQRSWIFVVTTQMLHALFVNKDRSQLGDHARD